MELTDIKNIYRTLRKDKQGKSEGFDSCDQPSNFA